MSRPKGSVNKPKFKQLQLDQVGVGSGIEKVTYGTSDNLIIPEQILQDEVTTTMKDMHHVVQKVSAENLPVAEEYLRSWFDKGYELTQVIFLGIEDAGATYALMYILIKRE